MGLTVTLLAYHEMENLKWLLPALKKVIDPLNIDSVEYLVVDSAVPTDDTEKVCRAFGARYVNQEEPGYGGAYRTAIRYAREEYFFLIDADGSPEHEKLADMYQQILNGADMVIGSRYVEGGISDDEVSSQIMSHFLNAVFRKALRLPVRDISMSMRLFHTKDLKQLFLVAENFEVSEELALKINLLKGRKAVIREVPIRFVKRRAGASKRSLFKFIVRLGWMLVYSIVLQFIAGENYIPGEHDRHAVQTTDKLLLFVINLLAAVLNLLLFLLLGKVAGIVPAGAVACLLAALTALAGIKMAVFNDWRWDRVACMNYIKYGLCTRFPVYMIDVLAVGSLVKKYAMNVLQAKAATVVIGLLFFLFADSFIYDRYKSRISRIS